ncbi:suppressor of fused domain protein [Planotetraspora silvatica]
MAEAIDRHIATHFGPVAFVLHEIASHLVGVHVYVVGPSAERPYQTLVTSGMSERPMTVPDGHGISPYAELMLCLPADWPLTQAALHDERTGWPVRVLKQVARLPHEYGTWITLLALIPLHPAEVMLKVSQGTDALIAALDRGGVSELLDPTRPSLV